MVIDDNGMVHGASGKFTGRVPAQPAEQLTPESQAWTPPYPTVADVDGHATVENDGDNQICECGNNTYSEDWVAADRNGQMSADSAGSSDPDEFTICPECGRVYTNADLFDAMDTPAPAFARLDTRSAAFIAALEIYNREEYGQEPRDVCPTHGGAWGGDATCTTCTGADGRALEKTA